MMKKLLFLLTLVSLPAIAQTTYVPDDNFEQYLIDSGYDDILDDYVLTANISSVTNLSMYNKNIEDLTGIEDFEALERLTCSNNTALTSIDVSSNLNLTNLSAGGTAIISLDVSNNTALESLHIGGTNINTIDLSHNPALINLYIHNTDIVNIDLSHNPALKAIDCYNTPITNLDLSNNPALERLTSYLTSLNSLDVSNNPVLEDLNINYNSSISILDVSNNPALKKIQCAETSITNLDLSNNPLLETLNCNSTPVRILNVSNSTALKSLNCSSTSISSLDLSNNPALESFTANNISDLEQINIKNGSNTTISTFSLSGNTNLTCVEVDDVAYSTTNWTAINNASVYSANCYTQPTTYVPDDNFEQALITLGYDTVLDDYVLTANITGITSLEIHSEDISDLTGIEDFVALEELRCNNNNISNLDVSNNTLLENLYCNDNPITSLIVSNNQLIKDLKCYNTNISTLDLSNNPALESLECYNTSLNVIAVSANPLLETVRCQNNSNLTYLNIKNGNNTTVTTFIANNNPNLTCVQVDDVTFSTNNWTSIPDVALYSENCFLEISTYIPDDEFENALIYLGYDTVLDDYVPTANISGVTSLNLNHKNISDLTGIEDFVALEELRCSATNISSLDLSNNTALSYLSCYGTSLENLDVSNNTLLEYLDCSYNDSLISVDVSDLTALTHVNCSYSELLNSLNLSYTNSIETLYCNNTALTSLGMPSSLIKLRAMNTPLSNIGFSNSPALEDIDCGNTALTVVDLSSNPALINISLYNNNLTELNVKNGANTNINYFNTIGNPNLSCIEVDDVNYSTTNWETIDNTSIFSENCSSLSVDQLSLNEFVLYPNPATDIFNVTSNQPITRMELFDISGKRVLQTSNATQVNISELQPGFYLLRIFSENTKTVKKLIIK
ncbi:T9SS type A sorting domain-containing protein [Polaribacter sp. MSW13]|uniref:T9SS type A sorting domain-containing protein n=1 Tax=Polaribacter marinus TaxID=2916838 RepID=A0A9X2AJ36_9FLAO|nr:T9SS type A sorting domain-containing protein [Polaribacter marinus]MCI2228687.1 T9SS type A sorting domain-containing protein [Polaribacter marinus]